MRSPARIVRLVLVVILVFRTFQATVLGIAQRQGMRPVAANVLAVIVGSATVLP